MRENDSDRTVVLATVLGSLLALIFCMLCLLEPAPTEFEKSLPDHCVPDAIEKTDTLDIVATRALVNQQPPEFVEGVKLDKARSGKWRALRDKILAAHPYCAYCGGTNKLQVHHIKPFHLDPSLELDPKNTIVLCEEPETDHHLHIGHLGNFKSENPCVVEDCAKHEAEMRSAGTWPRP